MSVYNAGSYLQEAMESILQQSLQNFEFVIVDDASTDGSGETLKNYAQQDSRIRLFNNEHNLGLTRSLNRGLVEIHGEFVARMDADDISEHNRLRRQIDFLLENPAIGMVGTGGLVITPQGTALRPISVLTGIQEIRETLFQHNCFIHGSTMIRREAIEAVGGYRQDFNGAEDYDLWLRMSQRFPLANLNEPLYRWRINPDGISVTNWAGQTRTANRASGNEAQTDAPEFISQILELEIDDAARGYLFWAIDFRDNEDYVNSLLFSLKALQYTTLTPALNKFISSEITGPARLGQLKKQRKL